MSIINQGNLNLEDISIEWFKDIGFSHVYGPNISPNGKFPERNNFKDVILKDRLRSALKRINPEVPINTIESALVKIINPHIQGLIFSNYEFHKWMTNGLPVSYEEGNQEIRKHLKVIDFDDQQKNDWLIVNQFEVDGAQNCVPDLVVYINGLPIAVIELDNPSNEKTDIWDAFNQLRNYKVDISDLFITNVLLVISDGTYAKVGSISSNEEKYMQWRVIEKEQDLDPIGRFRQLETLLRGLFDKNRLLDYIRSFCLFQGNEKIVKNIAAYHQFHAVNSAIERIVEASKPNGDRKGGVLWHTQGAGKSIEMVFLAGKLLSDRRLQNPTLVFVTSGESVNDQLFEFFSVSRNLLEEKPMQAESRKDLGYLLEKRPNGGIIFITIQKFAKDQDKGEFTALTDRKNIVLICDEIHRDLYVFKGIDSKTGEIKYGLTQELRYSLPKATLLAFSGFPIPEEDKDVLEVFGHYVSIYDIQQAVDDGATVPIYYESRLAKLKTKKISMPILDSKFDEIFEDKNDISSTEKAKSRWAALEALIGAESRLKQVAKDLIAHYEQRSKTQPGKALFVGMSREICARLYNVLIELKPDWHDEDHMKGSVKVVMTSSASESQLLQPHHTSKQQKKDLENRFKDPNDPLKIVLVIDMWLTGFDAPCLATMYVDKPMKGANLAQAIARVNRVFKDKPGGLIVDYIGIAPQLKEALTTYTAAKGKGNLTLDASEAVLILLEQIQIAKDLLEPVEWSHFRKKGKAFEIIPNCLDHILEIKDGKQRYCDTVLRITKAFALCGTTDEAIELSPEISFLQAMREILVKGTINGNKPRESNDFQLQQLLSESLVSEGAIDLFKVAGLKNPDMNIMSDEFLSEVSRIPQKNLAVELLQKLLNDDVKSKFRTNLVKQKNFSEILKASMNRYQNRAIEAVEVLEELIEISKKLREDFEKGVSLGISSSEQSFYNILANNPSANQLIKKEVLVSISKEISSMTRKEFNNEWQYKENSISKLKIKIKTLLKRNNYPSELISITVGTLLRQAEIIKKNN